MPYFFYSAPFGNLTLMEKNEQLIKICFGQISQTGEEKIRTPLLYETAQQLNAYFNKSLKHFDLPLNPAVSSFEKKVLDSLQTIPYGQTRTYQEVAFSTGHKNACRAVGRANHFNPLPIVIPCHRVIGKSGKLTGYAGGLEIKKFLLFLEQD